MASTFFLAPVINFLEKSLNGAITASATTVTLNNTTNVKAPGYCVIDRVNSAGTATPNSREVISFTGISGNDLTGVTRGADGSTARAHNDAAIVEFSPTTGMWNSLATIVSSGLTGDGYLKAIASPVTIAVLHAQAIINLSIASITRAEFTQFALSSIASLARGEFREMALVSIATVQKLNVIDTLGVVPSTGTAQFALDATFQSSVTLANNATIAPFGNTNNFSGSVLITDITDGNTGLYLVGGTPTKLVSQTQTSLSVTQDNATTSNFYFVLGQSLYLQNKIGSTQAYYLIAQRSRDQL